MRRFGKTSQQASSIQPKMPAKLSDLLPDPAKAPPKFQQGLVALLDVDDTTVRGKMGEDSILNTPMLQALKSQGITDVYLFTDMTARGANLHDRVSLIHALTQEGFTVRGVATPPDYAWHLPEDAVVDFSHYCAYCRVNIKGITDASVIDVKLREIFDETKIDEFAENQKMTPERIADFKKNLRIVKEFIAKPDLQGQKPIGSCFHETANDFTTRYNRAADDDGREEILSKHGKGFEKSQACKWLIDILAIRENLADAKGLMLRQFLTQQDQGIAGVVVCDDKQTVIDSVRTTAKACSTIPVCAIHVPKQTKPDAWETPKDYYQGEIDNFRTQNRLSQPAQSQLATPQEQVIKSRGFLSRFRSPLPTSTSSTVPTRDPKPPRPQLQRTAAIKRDLADAAHPSDARINDSDVAKAAGKSSPK